jgi:hypothetical protein
LASGSQTLLLGDPSTAIYATSDSISVAQPGDYESRATPGDGISNYRPSTAARSSVEEYGPAVSDLPIVEGPVAALGHYITGSRSPIQYPFANIDTSSIQPSKFTAVSKAIATGIPGQYSINANLGYSTSDFSSAAFVGRIVLNLQGILTVNPDGSYSFEGTLGALPDRYQFYSSTSRTALGEVSTRFGELLPGTPFTAYITGRKRITEAGGPRA